MACCCGHEEDEHGENLEYPGSTACNVEHCNCDFFEDEELDIEDFYEE